MGTIDVTGEYEVMAAFLRPEEDTQTGTIYVAPRPSERGELLIRRSQHCQDHDLGSGLPEVHQLVLERSLVSLPGRMRDFEFPEGVVGASTVARYTSMFRPGGRDSRTFVNLDDTSWSGVYYRGGQFLGLRDVQCEAAEQTQRGVLPLVNWHYQLWLVMRERTDYGRALRLPWDGDSYIFIVLRPEDVYLGSHELRRSGYAT